MQITLSASGNVSASARPTASESCCSDLLYRLLNLLELHLEGEGATLLEAANLYQREMRHTGPPLSHKKLIGATLLLKGLEYDHVVVLMQTRLTLSICISQ